MRNQKFLILALSAVLSSALMGCGGKQKSADNSGGGSAPAAAATGTITQEDTGEEDEAGASSNAAGDSDSMDLKIGSGLGTDIPQLERQGREPRCGGAHLKDSEVWFPGLPYLPLEKPLATGGGEQERGFIYTDARRDGVMAFLVERANKLPGDAKTKSKALAIRIVGVDVQKNGNNSTVKIDLMGERQGDAVQTVELKGARVLETRNKKDYSGALICADLEEKENCQNVVIEFNRLNSKGQKTRSVFLVYRKGESNIIMPSDDRVNFEEIENKEHRRFAEYLSNTAYNSCMVIKAAVDKGIRKMRDCAYQTLLQDCGAGQQFKAPYASNFILRSWAVAYGRSAFDITLKGDGSNDRVTFSGPLAYYAGGGVQETKLEVSGSSRHYATPKKAALMANDGGGELNLSLEFKGSPRAEMRVNVTSLLADTRYSADIVSKVSEGLEDEGLQPAVVDLEDEE